MYACIVLGYCHVGFKDRNFPELDHSIDIVVDAFVNAFPPEIHEKNTSFPEYTAPDPKTLKSMILALNAISWFLVENCQKVRDNYISYIDLVLGHLLQPSVHVLLHTEVIAGFTRLSMSRYNRRRIFETFQAPIAALTQLYMSFNAASSKSKINAIHSAKDGNDIGRSALQSVFCKLWNKWYPLPKDEFIVALAQYSPPQNHPFNVDSIIGDHGYLSRRKKLLIQNPAESNSPSKAFNLFSVADSLIKKRNLKAGSDFGFVLGKSDSILKTKQLRSGVKDDDSKQTSVYVKYFDDSSKTGNY